MRTLAFDGRTGASGDLVLGALLDAGADRSVLAPIEDGLDVTYETERVDRKGIDATDVTVQGAAESAAGDEHAHRSVDRVVETVRSIGLPSGVADDAAAIVRRLGAAEAAVHGTTVEEVAFHEVGADDAIADIAGAAALVADLDPDRIVTTPLAAGGGEATFSHGTYPVPVPAVTELAAEASWDLRGGPVDVELLTPTGAAILAHFADGVATLPSLDVERSGYGAGDRELEDRPNVLRVLLGAAQADLVSEDLAVLETNVDDVSPEVLGSLQETLQAAGARDVSIVPLTMKSARPGHLVRAIARPADAERVARRLADETGTLGVRRSAATHRWIADRRIETVTVDIDGEAYDLPVKVATDTDGERIDVSAEFDDARAAARETGVPVREVLRRAERAVIEELETDDSAP